MTVTQRDINVGRLEALKRERYEICVTIDGSVRAMLLQFTPLDYDFQYVESIVPAQLEIHVRNIRKMMEKLQRVKSEIERLKREIGD
jgi:hypothetical protein